MLKWVGGFVVALYLFWIWINIDIQQIAKDAWLKALTQQQLDEIDDWDKEPKAEEVSPKSTPIQFVNGKQQKSKSN